MAIGVLLAVVSRFSAVTITSCSSSAAGATSPDCATAPGAGACAHAVEAVPARPPSAAPRAAYVLRSIPLLIFRFPVLPSKPKIAASTARRAAAHETDYD